MALNRKLVTEPPRQLYIAAGNLTVILIADGPDSSGTAPPPNLDFLPAKMRNRQSGNFRIRHFRTRPCHAVHNNRSVEDLDEAKWKPYSLSLNLLYCIASGRDRNDGVPISAKPDANKARLCSDVHLCLAQRSCTIPLGLPVRETMGFNGPLPKGAQSVSSGIFKIECRGKCIQLHGSDGTVESLVFPGGPTKEIRLTGRVNKEDRVSTL
jgi:hypothetical protein